MAIKHLLPQKWSFYRRRSPNSQRHRFLGVKHWLLSVGVIAAVISLNLWHPATGFTFASAAIAPTANTNLASLETSEARSKALYNAEQFAEAIQVLQQLVQSYRQQGNHLRHAIALSNLSLAYQQLGQFTEAQQSVTASLELLKQLEQKRSISSDRPHSADLVLAQILDVQARLQFMSGQPELALQTWKQTTTTYAQAGDEANALRCRLNQAQALQAMGLYRQALRELLELNQALAAQPETRTKLVGLRSLGDALQAVGEPQQAGEALQRSLALARRLQLPEEISAALLSLGNVAVTQPERQTALSFYRQAAAIAPSPAAKVKAQLNQLSLLIELNQQTEAQALLPHLQKQIQSLPPGRSRIYLQISLAKNLLNLENATAAERSRVPPSAASGEPTAEVTTRAAAEMLMAAAQQAKQLLDPRAETHALGNLGALYEQTNQLAIAQDLTQKALLLSQAIQAPDITYRWQWQLGRILKAQGNSSAAIAAYSQAVSTLQALRNDLVAVNPDLQFSFRESIEPIYRQFVELLLQPQASTAVSPANLIQARNVIESLQVAELENFFREACLDVRFQIDALVDQATDSTAVLYPIILSDRLEIILKLPRQPLRHYTTPIAQTQVESALEELRQTITKPYSLQEVQMQLQQVYNWLIRPAAADLAASRAETLVFVLDGALRNIPMAALHDGQQYLIQQYSVALTPGLQLLNPQPLEQKKLQVLTAGLTESRHGLPPLQFVKTEVSQIQSQLPSVVLLDQAFVEPQLQQKIRSIPFSIVHLATHGQFSSDPNQTFIAAWDQKLTINQLSQLLRTREQAQSAPIELLVLSACETATGDKRAALGLAGVAIRAGARSTIASLWSLDDESSAQLMGQLYRELAQAKINKATALRNAQLSLLQSPQYQHPRYWAPYVLVGNWL
jgi:CHAT domain-containing protein